jgi:hypothetical protein
MAGKRAAAAAMRQNHVEEASAAMSRKNPQMAALLGRAKRLQRTAYEFVNGRRADPAWTLPRCGPSSWPL